MFLIVYYSVLVIIILLIVKTYKFKCFCFLIFIDLIVTKSGFIKTEI